MQHKPFYIIIFFLFLFSCEKKLDKRYENLPKGIYAEIETDKGLIVANLEFEKVPVTVANFISLAEGTNTRVVDSLKGKPFYDGLTFHRVISKSNGDKSDFMIQGGCPLGNGSGNAGYKFKDEFPRDSLGNLLLKHDSPGVLSMANYSGPSTNGSQFFITLVPAPHLDGKRTVFGNVILGQEVVNSIIKDDRINSIKIVRKGAKAKKFNAPKIFNQQFKKIDKIKTSFLNKVNKYKEKAIELPSGLKIYYLKKGNEKKPEKGSSILVTYSAYFTDGSLLATNEEEVAKLYDIFSIEKKKQKGYQPFTTKYSMDVPLVQGFKEGLQRMNFGDKVLLFTPAYLTYGSQGRTGVPPNTDLIFELEIFPKMDN